MSNFHGKSPCGKEMKNVNKYCDSWKEFSQPLADATNTYLSAFDPDIRLSDGKDTVQLPKWFVKRFNEKQVGVIS